MDIDEVLQAQDGVISRRQVLECGEDYVGLSTVVELDGRLCHEDARDRWPTWIVTWTAFSPAT